jgi:hypothetical protein
MARRFLATFLLVMARFLAVFALLAFGFLATLATAEIFTRRIRGARAVTIVLMLSGLILLMRLLLVF